jgi:hypothetical protein
VKKTAPKKMTLSRETLAVLTDSEPELKKEVLGGAWSDRCTTSRDVCCP